MRDVYIHIKRCLLWQNDTIHIYVSFESELTSIIIIFLNTVIKTYFI